MWSPLEMDSRYRALFEGALKDLATATVGNGIAYSAQWPLVWSPPRSADVALRVLVLGKASNGFARLRRNHRTTTDAARAAGSTFNPFPGGNYAGGFWSFLTGSNGVFAASELPRVEIAWSNLYKVARGFNDETAGASRSPMRIPKVAYSPVNRAPDGGIDNNPTRPERRAQDAERMHELVHIEVKAFRPDVVIALCLPWLVESHAFLDADPPWSPLLEEYGARFTSNFLRTDVPGIAGRHPIRVTGGYPKYASAFRDELERRGIVLPSSIAPATT